MNFILYQLPTRVRGIIKIKVHVPRLMIFYREAPKISILLIYGLRRRQIQFTSSRATPLLRQSSSSFSVVARISR